MATDFSRISIPRMSHFMVGGKRSGGVLFRPYTPEEHEMLSNRGTHSGLDAHQVWRLECSPSEPGDVLIDLGTPELNEEFVTLLDKALEVRGGLS